MQYAGECVKTVLTHTRCPRALGKIVDMSSSSRSKVLRKTAIECILVVLECWDTASFEREMPAVQQGIKDGLSDAATEVRNLARRGFWMYYGHSTKRGKALLRALDSRTRDLLNKDKPADIAGGSGDGAGSNGASKVKGAGKGAEGGRGGGKKRPVLSRLDASARGPPRSPSGSSTASPRSMASPRSGIPMPASSPASSMRSTRSAKSERASLLSPSALSAPSTPSTPSRSQEGSRSGSGASGASGGFGSEADVRYNEEERNVCEVGDRVSITLQNSFATGTVGYTGEAEFRGGWWIGVCLDTPEGRNDGTVKNVRYFDAEPQYGIFVRAAKVEVLDEEEDHATGGAGEEENDEEVGDVVASGGESYEEEQEEQEKQQEDDSVGEVTEEERTEEELVVEDIDAKTYKMLLSKNTQDILGLDDHEHAMEVLNHLEVASTETDEGTGLVRLFFVDTKHRVAAVAWIKAAVEAVVEEEQDDEQVGGEQGGDGGSGDGMVGHGEDGEDELAEEVRIQLAAAIAPVAKQLISTHRRHIDEVRIIRM